MSRLELQDFYDRSCTFTAEHTGYEGAPWRLSVETGVPGQAIDLSRRSIERLLLYLAAATGIADLAERDDR